MLDRRSPQRIRRLPRLTTPLRLPLIAVLITLATMIFASLLVLQIHREQTGLNLIGNRAAPQVVAASDLYFSLSDMDAQVANTLLVGQAKDLGFTRDQALGWGGFLGTEFRNITFSTERAAAESTLLAFQTYQVDDRHIRALATSGHLDEAIAFCTSYQPGQSNYAFTQYDQALARLITINQTAFDDAIRDGRDELRGWTIPLAVGVLAILVLLGVGIRSRVKEYR